MEQNSVLEILKGALTTDKSIEQKLVEAPEAEVLQASEQFRVVDEPTANWCVGKIAMWTAEVERRKKQAEEYVRDAENTLDRLIYCFGMPLASYAKTQLNGEKKKSLKLKSGTIGFRMTPDSYEVKDKEAYIEWCDATGIDGYKIETRCITTPAKEYHLKTGNLPNGVICEKGLEKFYCK